MAGDDAGRWPGEKLPAAWCWVDFTTFFSDFTDSHRKVPQKQYKQEGALPVVDQGATRIGGYTDDLSMQSGAPLPAIVFGDHTRAVKYIDVPFAQGADGVRVLAPNDYIEPAFSYQALRCLQLPDKGYSRHFKFLKASSFPLAPLPEQRRIVAKIDSLSGKSRRARDHLDHIPRLVEKYKQAVLAAAFEGRLAGCDFDWQERRLADVCKLVDGDRGANYPKRGDYHSEGHCLFLSTKNVRPNGFDFSECQYVTQQKHQEMRSGTLTRGDVVITTRGTVGNVAFYGDSVRYDVVRVNSGMLIMRPVPELSGDYLAWFVRSPQFTAQIAEQTTGSAQPQLPAGIMKRFSVRFPSIAQQPLVVQEIERALGQIDRLASEATSARRLIDRLDQAVLAKAFRGELVPQDHEDEPASVLVDRIRAECGAAPKAKRGRKTKAV